MDKGRRMPCPRFKQFMSIVSLEVADLAWAQGKQAHEKPARAVAKYDKTLAKSTRKSSQIIADLTLCGFAKLGASRCVMKQGSF